MSDGTELAFEIETSRGTGAMRATNPKTGETFSAQYTGTVNGGGIATANAYNWQTKQTTTTTAYIPPTSANAQGILRGDKGTVIELYLDIKPGLRPTGHGDGRDNHGERYQVQF